MRKIIDRPVRGCYHVSVKKEAVVTVILLSFMFQFFPALPLARALAHSGTKTKGEFCALPSVAHNCPMKSGADYCPLTQKTSYHKTKAHRNHNNYNENLWRGKGACYHFIRCADNDTFGGKGLFSEGKDMPCLTGTFSLEGMPLMEGRVLIETSLYTDPFKTNLERPPAAA